MDKIKKIHKNTHLLSENEKPDSSFYLIHMTDKKSLISILKSGELEEGIILANKGKISFTEMPLHALGFFKRRWPEYKGGENIEYGIGFTKPFLIDRGVKQAIYLNKKIKKFVNDSLLTMTSLNKEERNELATKYFLDINKIEQILDEINKSSTNSGEEYLKGGFTWEREWILTCKDFHFNYKSIGVICCPKEDQMEIWQIIKDTYPMEPDPNSSCKFKLSRKMRFVDVDYKYKKSISMLEKLADYEEIEYRKTSYFLTLKSFELFKEEYGIQEAMEKIRDIILISDIKEDKFIDESLLRQIILESSENLLDCLKELSYFPYDDDKKSLHERYTFSDQYGLFKCAILDEKNLRFNIIISIVKFILDVNQYESSPDFLGDMMWEDKLDTNEIIYTYVGVYEYGDDFRDSFWKCLYDVEMAIKDNLFQYLINGNSWDEEE